MSKNDDEIYVERIIRGGPLDGARTGERVYHPGKGLEMLQKQIKWKPLKNIENLLIPA